MARKARGIAVVLCNGGACKNGVAADSAPLSCEELAARSCGETPACPRGCLGGGSCAAACKFGAISMGENGAAVVDDSLCRGCGLCVRACPQHLIALRRPMSTVMVRCSNTDLGKVARKACPNSCIACGICVKACPAGALSIVDNHAAMDQGRCIACGMCAVSCPRGVIRDSFGIFTIA